MRFSASGFFSRISVLYGPEYTVEANMNFYEILEYIQM
jgi:hypothetical protein